MIGPVLAAALSLVSALSATPPSDPPGPGAPTPGGEDTSPERRFAELSFAIFVSVELDANPGAFSCATPDDQTSTVTCFTLTGDGRVIVAVSPTSDGTGVFDWTVVSDQPAGIALASTTTTTTTVASETTTTTPVVPPSTTTGPTTTAAAVNIADSSIQSYGASLNRSAAATIEDYLEFAEGAIQTINAYAWDPASATLTFDLTLNPANTIETDTAAWVLIQQEKLHWVRGQPFRLQGATLRPALLLVINGTRYESDFDLMVKVADQLIAASDWAAEARRQ